MNRDVPNVVPSLKDLENKQYFTPEDLGHLLVGPSGVKYRLFTGYLRDGSRQFNRANRGNRISLKTDSFV